MTVPPQTIPKRALLSFDPAPLAFRGTQQSVNADPSLRLPEPDLATVWVQASVAQIGERTRKGWALDDEMLGDGWKSIEGKFVNMAHNPETMYGYVADAVKSGTNIVSNMALGRHKLEAENIDPKRISVDYGVSPEWVYRPDLTKVVKGDNTYTMDEAAAEGMLSVNDTSQGVPEIICTDPEATMYPGGVEFYNLGLVPLRDATPNFPSSGILAATNAAGNNLTLTEEGSVEQLQQSIQAALTEKFGSDDKWVSLYRTYNTIVVYTVWDSESGKDMIYRVSWGVDAEGKIDLGDPTEMERETLLIDAENFAGVPLEAIRHLLDGDMASICYGSGAVPAEKKGGRKEPLDGYPRNRSSYADPTNYMHPLDTAERVLNACARFQYNVETCQYTKPELVFMARRIVNAARRHDITVESKTVVGRYAGLRARSKSQASSVEGGESAMEYTKEQIEELVQSARDEGMTAGSEAALKDVAENAEHPVRIALIEQYRDSELPGLLEQARTDTRNQIEAEHSALAALNTIKPLTEEETAVFTEALRAGNFDVEKETLRRENMVLKETTGTAASASTNATAEADRAAAGQRVLSGENQTPGDTSGSDDPEHKPQRVL